MLFLTVLYMCMWECEYRALAPCTLAIMAFLSLSKVVVFLLGFVVGTVVVLFSRSNCPFVFEDRLDDDLSSDGHSTVKAFMGRLVTVTAISDNHFDESQYMLSSVETCLPQNKIILYDLGLSENNKRMIQELYKTVQIRPFPFSDYYKNNTHVRDLLTFAWKPIIIKKVSQENDIIMYGDASMRMKSCNITAALSQLLYFPFFAAVGLKYIAIEFIHDGMIEYLQYPKARKDLAHMYSIEATGFLLWANAMMKEVLIEPWFDCALKKECIAPAGAKISPCHFTNNHDGHYVGCHRYDQSALDLILAREFGATVPLKAQNAAVSGSIWCFLKGKYLGRLKRFLC